MAEVPICILKVRVNPRSSRNMVVGWKGDSLSVKLTAPPVEGAANKACIEFIAGLLGVKKGSVTILSGAASRDKIFRIEGVSREDVRRIIIESV